MVGVARVENGSVLEVLVLVVVGSIEVNVAVVLVLEATEVVIIDASFLVGLVVVNNGKE